MKIFLKKNKEHKELHPFMVKALLCINKGLKLWAGWLQQKTNQYSIKKIKILLLLFCAIFLSESIWVLYQGFQKEKAGFIIISPIHRVPLLKEQTILPVLNEEEFKRIHSFKIYLDSLQNTAKGKLKFDSFLSNCPNIQDTINYLENIYYEQQTNRK
jgi:hypothetical protein